MFSINLEKISDNIIPSTQKLIQNLEKARDIIASTKVAEDFYYYTELKHTIPENIANSKVEMEKFKSWLDYAALKAQHLEEINGILVGEELGEIDATQTKTNLENFIKDNPNMSPEALKVITSEVIAGCGDNATEEFYDIIVDVYEDEIISVMPNEENVGTLGRYIDENRDSMNPQILSTISCEVLKRVRI